MGMLEHEVPACRVLQELAESGALTHVIDNGRDHPAGDRDSTENRIRCAITLERVLELIECMGVAERARLIPRSMLPELRWTT